MYEYHTCLNCGYEKMHYLPLKDIFRCPECNHYFTLAYLEHEAQWKKKNPPLGLFQIHIGHEEMKKLIDEMLNQYMPSKQPKFDYRQKAAAEFDCEDIELPRGLGGLS